jgi:hypothetical protein
VRTQNPGALEVAGRGGPATSFLLGCDASNPLRHWLPKLFDGNRKMRQDPLDRGLIGVNWLTRTARYVRLIGFGLGRFNWSGVSGNGHKRRLPHRRRSKHLQLPSDGR